MRIVRTLVEDFKEPENKSVYWLDLNDKIVKRWSEESWVPIVEIDWPDIQNVNIVGDQIPVRDVNIINDIKINDDKPIDINITNNNPIQVELPESPLQVEVTNQMEIDSPLDVNISNENPIPVEISNPSENPIIVELSSDNPSSVSIHGENSSNYIEPNNDGSINVKMASDSYLNVNIADCSLVRKTVPVTIENQPIINIGNAPVLHTIVDSMPSSAPITVTAPANNPLVVKLDQSSVASNRVLVSGNENSRNFIEPNYDGSVTSSFDERKNYPVNLRGSNLENTSNNYIKVSDSGELYTTDTPYTTMYCHITHTEAEDTKRITFNYTIKDSKMIFSDGDLYFSQEFFKEIISYILVQHNIMNFSNGDELFFMFFNKKVSEYRPGVFVYNRDCRSFDIEVDDKETHETFGVGWLVKIYSSSDTYHRNPIFQYFQTYYT